MAEIYCVRADFGTYVKQFIEGSYIAIGWLPDINLENVKVRDELYTTHSLAPLTFRGATFSGVFTLLPLLTGIGHANHGHILREAAVLADSGKLKPLMNTQRFSTKDIEAAHTAVEAELSAKLLSKYSFIHPAHLPNAKVPGRGCVPALFSRVEERL